MEAEKPVQPAEVDPILCFPSGEVHPSDERGCQGTWCGGDGFCGRLDARAGQSRDGRRHGAGASLGAGAFGGGVAARRAACQR